MIHDLSLQHEPVSPLTSFVFMLLNIADAWLTQQLLAHGGIEAFWWSAGFNSDIIIKVLLALGISILLVKLNKPHLISWLNTGMTVVVLSNMICFAGYLVSWTFWEGEIVYL